MAHRGYIEEASEKDSTVAFVVGVAQVDTHTDEAGLQLTKEETETIVDNRNATRDTNCHLLWRQVILEGRRRLPDHLAHDGAQINLSNRDRSGGRVKGGGGSEDRVTRDGFGQGNELPGAPHQVEP